jgi:asparagine synthase (glutamine-hydrolysing)
MCGIAGCLQQARARPAVELTGIVRAMAASLRHRGPDAGGTWVDGEVGIALGHRRLSIIDLSDAGAQPMHSASGRYVVAYNGEIYNFQSLGRELAALGHTFRGHSDTEVLLAAIDQWGVEAALGRLNGMFAFALWDRRDRVLTLARDRVGKKPLYYGWCADGFLFGSELKALRRHPDFDGALDRDALAQYLQYGWFAGPWSIYAKVRKLPPGCWLRLPLDAPPWTVGPQPFWSARQALEAGQRATFAGREEEAVGRLEHLLEQAVSERMVADVELGALLSGGIDSSTVVALMQRVATRPVRTFCIGFHEARYNEAEHAANIARFLGTDHQELYVTPGQCLDVVDQLPDIYDEPLADVSQVPTVLIARLARQEVKVVLSGDGGDELFGGYRDYLDALRQWRWCRRLPRPLRSAAAGALAGLAHWSWDAVDPGDPAAMPRAPAWRRLAPKWARRARGWPAASPQELLARHRARCPWPSELLPGARPPITPLSDPEAWARSSEPLPGLLQFDFVGYLPGDILVKVDRASMAVGLEVRCPLLDARVVEFAWTLPPSFLIDAAGGKRILKQLLARHLPRSLTERPKRGFGVPLDAWLRGPLRPWAEELLAEPRLRRQGMFEVGAVRRLWAQHLSHWQNHVNLLWAILMFQAWLDVSARAAPAPGRAHAAAAEPPPVMS